MSRPTSTQDLFQSERRFVAAMREIGFGRFEFLRIEHGELLLDPWPTTVRGVKFGSEDAVTHKSLPGEFELKGQVAEFFAHADELVHHGFELTEGLDLAPIERH